MKISKKRLRQIILEEIEGLFEWPNFDGGGAPSLIDSEEAAETFKGAFETGEDLYAGMEDEGPHDEGEFSLTDDVEELEGSEAFGVGVEAGRDMVKDELEKLLQALEGPYAAGMEDEGPVEEVEEY